MTTEQKKKIIRISIVIAVVIVLVVGLPKLWHKEAPKNHVTVNGPTASSEAKIAVIQEGENAGMEIDVSDAIIGEEIIIGSGTSVRDGDKVKVHYVGTLQDGTVFDSSVDRGEPVEFVVGEGKFIPGIEQGVTGMQKECKRKLTVPPSQAFGYTEHEGVPAGSTVIFEVELLDIIPG